MKPAYWIGIMAVVGAVVGYATFKLTGWPGSGLGTVIGILIGVVIYVALRNKQKDN